MKLFNIYTPLNLMISTGLSIIGVITFDMISSTALAQEACVRNQSGNVVCGTLVQDNVGQNNVMSPQRIETNGFRFELQGCVRGSDNTANCDVLITNIGDQTNTTLTIYRSRTIHGWEAPSRAISSLGDLFSIKTLRLGGNQRSGHPRSTFVYDVPVRLTLTFDNMTSQTTQLALLEIGFQVEGVSPASRTTAQFRDVSILSR
ncbi:hypothetical protein IQ215_01290 [Cyanobacterium stanieri LEGE 03274]|uniref:Uncharacterized protein n=1 Tax=Cyanobacterium stanieri LEGE 03274 TaxID=1828756 RepID=A0ABR9V194_9CHRO|nr:hypothetical protein [Cyanobacterium stanieri]MBE9221319.1 hypothetical protein [Cyanobacterium stanieri LEGE 03274]